jgi:hypothetical protein
MTSKHRDREFADLLSAVMERHAVASRLRGVADLAEDTLAEAMRVGDAVRRALRRGGGDRPDEADCAGLARLARRLAEATDAVLAQPLADELRRASSAGDGVRAATLALELFAGLTRPAAIPGHVYSPIAPRRRSRSGEALVHPVALAGEIVARTRDGLAPASGEEADRGVLPEPIAVAPSFAGADAEISLVRKTTDLGDAILEDGASGDLLVFCRRLHGPFAVALAAEADDEWWSASSFRWADYREQLTAALRQHGLEVNVTE